MDANKTTKKKNGKYKLLIGMHINRDIYKKGSHFIGVFLFINPDT